MKKRMMLLTAGMVVSASMAQNIFAEEETDGIKKIADMIEEAQEITDKTTMVSMTMALGSMEFSTGTTIRMTPCSAAVDMLYLSAPNDDGTFFDLVSEDAIRIFDERVYLNTGLVDEVVSELSEENYIEEDENVLQIVDSLTGDWIGLTAVKRDKEQIDDGWTQLFSGFAAAHTAGSYTINLENEQILQVLERLDAKIEEGMFDNVLTFDLDELLMPYVDAIIDGRKEAEPDEISDINEERRQLLDEFDRVIFYAADDETESFAKQFSGAAKKGLEVSTSICAGKDSAAGTYAFEVTIEAEIPQELQDEWGIEELESLVGETEDLTAEADEPCSKNALFKFVVSIEPEEEPIEIEEPQEGILWLTELLKKWSAAGLLENK